MSHVPEIECTACDGHGIVSANSRHIDIEQCPACNGEGWRPMNDDELEAAAERQAEAAQFRADLSLEEQQMRAFNEKHGRTFL
jgi:Zn-finger nucleic acid-binding protein